MKIQQPIDIVSRRWPVIIKNYWFGQRPRKHAIPDIARLISIPSPLEGARNSDSWTLLTDLSGTDSDLMALLQRDTRNLVRRAEREGISAELFDCHDLSILDDFNTFYDRFSESKPEVTDVLRVSVQFHMLKVIAQAGMLGVSRAVGRDGEPLVYHVFIVAEGRARLFHSASLFREGQNREQRNYLGWANRYLHWQEMLHYRDQGYSLYDMGGWYAGKDNESLLRVNRFKEEFGGKIVHEYDVMIGCSLKGKLALHAQDWFQRLIKRGSDGQD